MPFRQKHGGHLDGQSAEHEHLDAHITVVGVEALYGEFRSLSAKIVKPLTERPWNCKDFYVEDTDGYILCFSEQNNP
jgi:hypothetical protein